MAIGPARTDTDNVRLFLPQHFVIVGILRSGTGFLYGLFPALLVGIGNRYQLNIVEFGIWQMQPVSVVACSRAADSRSSIDCILSHDILSVRDETINLANSPFPIQIQDQEPDAEDGTVDRTAI
jgi:hypothetical protein